MNEKKYYADGAKITYLSGEPVVIKWPYVFDSLEHVEQIRHRLNRLYNGSACFLYLRETQRMAM
jgi:hypothetical protein